MNQRARIIWRVLILFLIICVLCAEWWFLSYLENKMMKPIIEINVEMPAIFERPARLECFKGGCIKVR